MSPWAYRWAVLKLVQERFHPTLEANFAYIRRWFLRPSKPPFTVLKVNKVWCQLRDGGVYRSGSRYQMSILVTVDLALGEVWPCFPALTVEKKSPSPSPLLPGARACLSRCHSKGIILPKTHLLVFCWLPEANGICVSIFPLLVHACTRLRIFVVARVWVHVYTCVECACGGQRLMSGTSLWALGPH